MLPLQDCKDVKSYHKFFNEDGTIVYTMIEHIMDLTIYWHVYGYQLFLINGYKTRS